MWKDPFFDAFILFAGLAILRTLIDAYNKVKSQTKDRRN